MLRDKRLGKIRQTQLVPNPATGQNPEQKSINNIQVSINRNHPTGAT
jgi:hypothetical protein